MNSINRPTDKVNYRKPLPCLKIDISLMDKKLLSKMNLINHITQITSKTVFI